MIKEEEEQQAEVERWMIVIDQEEEWWMIVIDQEEEKEEEWNKAAIKEEPNKAAIKEERNKAAIKEKPNEAERKQIEDDGGAGKRSQAEEGGRKVPDDGWLERIVLAIAVLLVITWLASPLLCPAPSTRPMAEQVSAVLSD
jgi:hypothetical protein